MAEVIVSNASVNVYPVNVEVDQIKTIVDSINAYVPDTGSMTDIESKLNVSLGHVHNVERWFGSALVPNAEIHVADNILTTTTWFTADAGNDTWGSWLQVMGSGDTPNQVGKTLFDLHRLYVAEIERGGLSHYIQIGWGTTGAAALSAGNYTELVYKPVSTANAESPIQIICKRIPVGTKVWLRVRIPSGNTGTFSFYVGIHEYTE